ncbi:MAG TPA: response regulator [Thermoanaerobaculia bacterium]|nr:response regulator [Thermoanaerobaculia bacterium]
MLLRGLAGLLAMILSSSVSLVAQELAFTHFTPRDQRTPLSSASVQKVVQDRLGYIWLAFYSSGLARYDGHAMDNYTVADGLADLTVREIIEDAAGHLWVGSDAGLVTSEEPLRAYEPGRRIRFVSQVGTVRILQARVKRNCLIAAGDGSVWAATQEGVRRYRFSDGHLMSDAVPLGDSQPGSPVVALGAGGGAVIATQSGGVLLAFDPNGKARGRLPAAGLESVTIGAITEARDSKALWLGGVDGSVWRLEDGRAVLINHDLTERIVTVLETSQGELWAASLGSGAVRIDPHHPADRLRVRRTNGLLGDTLWNLLEDREGNLWLAQNGGVSRLKKDYRAFLTYTGRSHAGEPPALPDPAVFAEIAPDSTSPRPWNGVLWAGTGGGLAAIMPDGTTTTLRVADGLLSNSVYTLATDAAGRLWIGTVGGVNCLSAPEDVPPPAANSARRSLTIGGRQAVLSAYPGDVIYAARAFNIRGVPSVWFAGTGAVSCLIGGEWFIFRAAAGLPPAGATSIAIDDDGFVWTGTADSGLFRSDITLTVEALRSRLPAANNGSREITARVFSRTYSRPGGVPFLGSIRTLLWYDHRLWIGTAEGLAILAAGATSGATLATLGPRELGGGMVMGVAPSPVTGHVWASQNAGLAEIDPKTLRVVSGVSKDDGLADNESWAYGPVAVDRNGRVYLGTPSGLSVIDPAMRLPNPQPPIVRLRRVEMKQGQRGDNELLIEYAALTFINEPRVRYRTRLAGYDRDWSPEKSDTEARFMNLPAFLFSKRYTFEVQARNADGIWSKAPVSWSFAAEPAWWLRWWAFLGYLAVLFATISLLGRLRMLRLKRRNRLLEDLVLARTDEIRAQARELESLDRMVQVINREVGLENVFQSILEQGMKLFPQAEKGSFLALDHERRRCQVLAVSGYSRNPSEMLDLSIDEAIKRYSEGAEEIDRGVYLVKDFDRLGGRDKAKRLPVPKCTLAMEVTLGGRVEGFLLFDNFSDPDAFHRSDLRRLSRVREHAISAISKARILHELEVKNQEAEAANRAKSTFLANMSHELRPPMNAIIGFSEILTERLRDTIEPKSLGFLKAILTSGQLLLNIINDILDLSKVEAGKMELQPETFPVRAAIESVCQVMRGFSSSKTIIFEVEVAPDVTDIETDQAKFKQILYNLMSNAVKFSPPGSVVTIGAHHVDGDGSHAESIAIDVIDRGIGIAPENQELIFEEFRQVDGTVSRQYGGTGLGLSLVKKFVELQGGSVAVRSTPAEGSVFTFTLPRHFAGPAIPGPIVKLDGTLIPAGERVLVVEDDDASYDALSSYLSSAGFVPIRARHGDEALSLARAARPIAVTLDLVLPGMDGWEVLRKLKGDESTAEIPVIVVSILDNRELGIAFGADDYFTKPVDWSRFLRRLRELTAGSGPQPKRPRLLLIDDDETVHTLLEPELEREGYQLDRALSGPEGLDRAEKTQPDVIILDLSMPGMTGFEVALQLKQRESTARIPIVVLTATSLSAEDRESLRSRTSGLVLKGNAAGARLVKAIRALDGRA